MTKNLEQNFSTSSLSGKQMAAVNLQRFNEWIVEREAAADWSDYIRNGKLNRSEIATECGFALSVVRQNPAVKAALETLESRLQLAGILQHTKADFKVDRENTDIATTQAAEMRILAAKSVAERRVKSVEEQNAALKAEVNDLKQQLKQYKFLGDHLAATGRILRP